MANGFCSRHPSKHAVPQLLPKESLEHFRCLLRLKERAPYLSLFKPRVTKSELARVFSANNAVCARLVSVLIGEKHFRRHCRAQCAVIWTRSDAAGVHALLSVLAGWKIVLDCCPGTLELGTRSPRLDACRGGFQPNHRLPLPPSTRSLHAWALLGCRDCFTTHARAPLSVVLLAYFP